MNSRVSPEAEKHIAVDGIEGRVSQAMTDLSVLANLVSDYGRNVFPLTMVQIEELDSASKGESVRERADQTDRDEGTINRHRHELIKNLGANSMPHAVRKGIIAGILPVEFDPKPKELEGNAYTVMSLISHGLSGEMIARRMNISSRQQADLFNQAKSALDAKNRPHAVRRAFEAQVFAIPGGTDQAEISTITELVDEAELLLSQARELAEQKLQPTKPVID